jgi:hypothetical protein
VDDPKLVAGWINEAQGERLRAERDWPLFNPPVRCWSKT